MPRPIDINISVCNVLKQAVVWNQLRKEYDFLIT